MRREIPPNTVIKHLRLCRVRYITTLPTTRVRSTNPPMLPITMTSEFVFHRDAENRFPCEIRVSLRIYNSSRLLNRQINKRNIINEKHKKCINPSKFGYLSMFISTNIIIESTETTSNNTISNNDIYKVS